MIKVLTAQYGDYGLPPRQSSFAMHASVVKHYFEGAAFPVGGSGAIVSTVNEVLEAHGAQIMTNAEVAEIRIEQGKVLGVTNARWKGYSCRSGSEWCWNF